VRPIEVIPSIDLSGGRCVRLLQGDFAQETVFSDDPVAVAREWERRGGRRLHIVDLDGARVGEPQNWEIVERIVAAVTIPVQLGGGLSQALLLHKSRSHLGQLPLVEFGKLDVELLRHYQAKHGIPEKLQQLVRRQVEVGILVQIGRMYQRLLQKCLIGEGDIQPLLKGLQVGQTAS
jgi:hypothetical protein